MPKKIYWVYFIASYVDCESSCRCHPKICNKNKYNPEPKAVPLLIIAFSIFYLSPLSDDDAWIANPNARTDWHFDR